MENRAFKSIANEKYNRPAQQPVARSKWHTHTQRTETKQMTKRKAQKKYASPLKIAQGRKKARNFSRALRENFLAPGRQSFCLPGFPQQEILFCPKTEKLPRRQA